jgi:pimeloyl-ACP methyl ester carboxylesterase
MRMPKAKAVLLVVLCGAAITAQRQPSGPAPGVLVPVGSHSLHLRCVGPGGQHPTVILEAGGGGYSTVWSRVQDLLVTRVRTCAYDRAGLGWSQPGPAPRTMTQEVFELHNLLQAAKIPAPYVLVGHSIGGLLVRLYTERYGKDVIGLVLVDPTHESSVLFNLRVNRWVRIRELATGRAVPEPRQEGTISKGYNPDDDYLAEEMQQIFLSRQANPESLGNRPLIVLAAAKPGPPPPGTSQELAEQLGREKDEQKSDLAKLSRNSKLVRDPSSGHNIHVDNSQLVANSINEVVDAATKAIRLAP